MSGYNIVTIVLKKMLLFIQQKRKKELDRASSYLQHQEIFVDILFLIFVQDCIYIPLSYYKIFYWGKNKFNFHINLNEISI
jgi:hypothetical protein